MNITPELIIAVSALFAGIAAALGQYRSNGLLARKDEVTLLRDEVVRLQGRVDSLEQRNVTLNNVIDSLRTENGLLREEIYTLRSMLRENKIELPPSKMFPLL